MRRFLTRLSLLTLVLLVGVAAEAQQGGATIRGRVTDQQEGILPGVALVVTHMENGTVRETVSGPDGTYLVPGLVPGPYRVVAMLEASVVFLRKISSCASVPRSSSI